MRGMKGMMEEEVAARRDANGSPSTSTIVGMQNFQLPKYGKLEVRLAATLADRNSIQSLESPRVSLNRPNFFLGSKGWFAGPSSGMDSPHKVYVSMLMCLLTSMQTLVQRQPVHAKR